MIKYATKEQVEKLLKKTQRSIRDHAIFTVMYWRGLRASEVGMLQVSDWRPETGRLYVRRAKNGISAEYLVSDAEKRALAAWLRVRGTAPGPMFLSRRSRNGSPITVRAVQMLFRRYAELANWPPELRHPHVLRHSIAVHLVERGIDVLAIRDWLGHRNIASTMVYAQMTNPARDKIAAAVYADPEPKIKVDWKRERRR